MILDSFRLVGSRMTGNSVRILALVLFSAAFCSAGDHAGGPRVFILRPESVQAMRDQVRSGKQDTPAVTAIRVDAERALSVKPPSVIDKSGTPPSGDKHDYMSLAPYWWPDPKSPTGLPYIRRDGERNPELSGIPDHKNFDTVMSSSQKLALAYYIFGDERYAQKATELLRVWFIDPPTRMNPNLRYAQAVKGHNDGRGTGLIETRSIGRIVDAVGLLERSKSWTPADDSALHDWCARFLDWMLTSPNGKDEAAAKNNHGSFYDAQVAVLALFVGRTDLAHSILQHVAHKRIATQVQRDGSQPLELARTKSFHYSAFNLEALFELARLGENVGVDLWSFESKDGGPIRGALDYLLPYADGTRKWPYQELEPITGKELVPFLMRAADQFHSPEYRAAALKLDHDAAGRADILLSTGFAAAPASR